MSIRIFKSKMLLIGGIFLLPLAIFAQTNTVYGTVGNQLIDQTFINGLQLLSPEFGFTPNADAFKSRLFKTYVLTKAKADLVKTRPVYKADATQKLISMIRQLAEEKYLASLYDRSQTETTIPVNDAEARAYYDTHILQYTEPGRYSYFVAYVNDTLKTPVRTVINQLNQYAAVIKEDFKTGDKNSYYITFEKDKSVSANDFVYAMLSKLKSGEYTIEPNGGSAVMIYMLGAKTPEVVTSFDRVKEQCKGMVINVKREKAAQDFIESVQKKYPVTLDSPLFK